MAVSSPGWIACSARSFARPRWGDVWVVATRRAGERVDVAALGISIDVAALYADLALGPPTAPARD
jgi:hypothetical protein